MLEIAREKMPKAHLVRADISQGFPAGLAEEKFDAILSTYALHHLTDEQKAAYESLLDVSGLGVMGYIEIPGIDCSLPIYHGTEESVLQVAVGHLEWSSLPVGGEGTHCVLSGHRGASEREAVYQISIS